MIYLVDSLSGARVALHELGHVLGLTHPHTSEWALVGMEDDSVVDNERYTVMSYEYGGLDVQNYGSAGHALRQWP